MRHLSDRAQPVYLGVWLSGTSPVHIDAAEWASMIGDLARVPGACCCEKHANECVFVFDALADAIAVTEALHKGFISSGVTQQGLHLSLFAASLAAGRNCPDPVFNSLAMTNARQLARLTENGQTLLCGCHKELPDAARLRRLNVAELAPWYRDKDPRQYAVYQLLTHTADATRTMLAAVGDKPNTRVQCLCLRWRDQRLTLAPHVPDITIGRSAAADVVVNTGLASREHAQLSFLDPCFVLSDCSTNGTYVTLHDKEIYIHDDQIVLRSSGVISLGRRAASAKGKLLYFSTETADTTA